MANNFKLLAIIGSGLLVAGLVGCEVVASGISGSGKIASETRKLSNYHTVEITVPAKLTVEVGKAGDLSIEADDNLLPHIITQVKDGTLEIKTDKSFNNTSQIEIKAKTAILDQLIISGATSTVVNGLAGDKFGVKASGASKITANGKVKKLSASLSGATSLKAADLSAEIATVSISGAGNAEINAANDLNATLSGVGSIKYKGNPKITKQISGVGSIQRM